MSIERLKTDYTCPKGDQQGVGFEIPRQGDDSNARQQRVDQRPPFDAGRFSFMDLDHEDVYLLGPGIPPAGIQEVAALADDP
jgi:hypothetical protein